MPCRRGRALHLTRAASPPIRGPLENLAEQDRLPNRSRIAGGCHEITSSHPGPHTRPWPLGLRGIVAGPLESGMQVPEFVCEGVLDVAGDVGRLRVERADVTFAGCRRRLH